MSRSYRWITMPIAAASLGVIPIIAGRENRRNAPFQTAEVPIAPDHPVRYPSPRPNQLLRDARSWMHTVLERTGGRSAARPTSQKGAHETYFHAHPPPGCDMQPAPACRRGDRGGPPGSAHRRWRSLCPESGAAPGHTLPAPAGRHHHPPRLAPAPGGARRGRDDGPSR